VESLCPICPWGRELREPQAMERLMRFLSLLDAGCPLERHELTNSDWVRLGLLRAERSRLLMEKKYDGEPL